MMSFILHTIVLVTGGTMLGIGIGLVSEGTAEKPGFILVGVGFLICAATLFLGVHQ